MPPDPRVYRAGGSWRVLILLLLLATIIGQGHAAAWVVTSDADTADAGTLRWAILQANANPGLDEVRAGQGGAGHSRRRRR